MTQRSDCPISTLLDFVGDKWSLLIVRDLMFFGKSSFSELQNSDERMATNILSSRLEKLEQDDLIQKQTDPNDRRKKIYKLTEQGKSLLPILLEMIIWSSKHAQETNLPEQLLVLAATDREGLIADLLARLEQ
ncbi:helix-turn-helix transcriptional regulator [Shewanella sp. WXL01]|uniref:winged helix-turn-helix transcriptional regulator n=1 Tax=Shewanella sp. WXL01 TaxID=2709721 RepID=UPI0014383D8C|nr:helix-turn-helix domain-containing protein [Shewanella sp. WXL01]NKF50307.1 helix-turn-helix transcriptional regulator [Shewanella sp. WXL01]